MFADSIEIILINLTYDIFGLLVISRHKNIHITVTKKAGYHFFFTFLELEKIVGYIRMPEMRILGSMNLILARNNDLRPST